MASSKSSSINVINTIIEFFEVSIHQLLYIHEIYPLGIFSRKQKYGVPVQISGHPLVNNYITRCLTTALDLLRNNALANVVLVFLTEDNKIIRKINFDLSQLKQELKIEKEKYKELELALRDTFLRISVSDRHVTQLPKGCKFKILLATNEQSHADLSNDPDNLANQDFPWVKCNEDKINQGKITPITSFETLGDPLQIYIEDIEPVNSNCTTPTPVDNPDSPSFFCDS